MAQLDDIVDSLSPVVAPLPYLQGALLPPCADGGLNRDDLSAATRVTGGHGVHRTYYDRLMVQARADALLCAR